MKPTPKAAALVYDKNKDFAPKVLASGSGKIAQAILSKAKEFEIPIFSNPALVNSLIHLEIEETIPEELYQSVVEVFIWLQNTQTKAQLSESLKS